MPGTGGGDRLTDAADFLGGVGLEVPEVEMTGSAVVEEEDAGADGEPPESVPPPWPPG